MNMASRNTWIWGTFGGVLFGGIAVGYAPDLMLAIALRSAKSDGLLNLTPTPVVRQEDDARLAFERAVAKFPNAPGRLASDFARQVRTPDASVTGYLKAMALASARSGYSSPNGDDLSYGRYTGDEAFLAGKALSSRARDETTLLPAARIAGHYRAQRDVVSLGLGAVLANRVLDRAAKLGLEKASLDRVAAVLGPPLAPREAIRRHVAEKIDRWERESRDEGPKVSRTRQEGAYLRFWRDFLLKTPDDARFAAAVEKADGEIQTVEARSGEYFTLESIVGPTATPWTAWVETLDRANARLR